MICYSDSYMAVRASFDGFVLKKHSLLEMTQSVTLFTRQKGKMHHILKGGQKITSRRSAHLQTGNLIRIDASLHTGGSWYVNTTELISGFSILKESTDRVRVLYNLCMVLDRLLPLEQAEPTVYDMLVRALIHLNETQLHYDRVFFSFFADIYAELGYGVERIETYDDAHDIVRELVDEKVRFLL